MNFRNEHGNQAVAALCEAQPDVSQRGEHVSRARSKSTSKMNRRLMIYLDYNATTPLCDAAREAMLPYLDRYFGNPSSVHAAGREARAAIDNARDKLAALLRAKPGEIIFTSGATESCNLGVLGLARSASSRGGHIISNKAEHHAVLNAAGTS